MKKLFLLVGLILIFVSLCGCTYEYSLYPNEVKHGKITVHYSDNVDDYYASKLARVLDEYSDHEVSFYVDKNDNGYIVEMPSILDSPSDVDDYYKQVFDQMAVDLSEEIFDGERVVLKILNEDGDVLYTTTSY